MSYLIEFLKAAPSVLCLEGTIRYYFQETSCQSDIKQFDADEKN